MIFSFEKKWADWIYADVRHFPHGVLLHTTAFTGSFGWTLPSEKVRLYQEGSKVKLGETYALEPDIARLYLDVKYQNKRGAKITKDQITYFTGRDYHPPMFAVPCIMDEAVYLDIKSAYWQILGVVGWDVDYKPDAFLGVKSDMADFPYPHLKVARSALVSMSRPSSLAYWSRGKHYAHKTMNRNLNTQLWALVCDVLNGIANDMLKVGCVYIHTDGFIIPHSSLGAAMDIMGRWGLKASVKHIGACEVKSVGAYKFGEKIRTKKMDIQGRRAHFGVQDVSGLKSLRRRFRRLSELGRIDTITQA